MATRTISDAGGNWNEVGTWVEGAVPLSTDNVVATPTSGQVTVNITTAKCSTLILTNYVAQMTFTAGMKLTVTTTVTFVAGMSLAGTGTLQISDTGTITSAGLIFPGSIIFYGGTFTLADTWTVTGNVTCQGGNSVLNGNTLNIGGNLTLISYDVSGTTNIVLNGTGTWSSSTQGATLSNNITINTAGTITLGTAVAKEGGIFTYTAGTVNAGNSTFYTGKNTTLNIDGMSLYNFTIVSMNFTLTLGSDLNITNNFTLNYNVSGALTMAGNYSITCGKFYMYTYQNVTFNFVSSQTFTINTGLYLNGRTDKILTIKAVTASTAFNLVFNGTAANCSIYRATFTDVNASDSAIGLDNWYGGTLTRTTNITNRTSADIGGTTQNVFGII